MGSAFVTEVVFCSLFSPWVLVGVAPDAVALRAFRVGSPLFFLLRSKLRHVVVISFLIKGLSFLSLTLFMTHLVRDCRGFKISPVSNNVSAAVCVHDHDAG